MSVVIGGAGYANSGDTAYFTSSVKGEEGSVSYQWYYRVSPSQSWVKDDGATRPNYSRTFYNPGGYQDQAVKVEVESVGETASDIHPVQVYQCDDLKSNSEVTAMNPCPQY